MKKITEKQLFMVRLESQESPNDTGNRLIRGTDLLGRYVTEELENISADSKEKMRNITEWDPQHLMESFQGRVYVSIYPESGSKCLRIYLISVTIEA